MQCHSQSVGKDGDDATFYEMCNATHSLLVRGKDVMTAFHKMCNITHKQLVIGKNVMHCLSQNMGCHTLPVGHRKRCDDIAHHKMCSVTHNLLVI